MIRVTDGSQSKNFSRPSRTLPATAGSAGTGRSNARTSASGTDDQLESSAVQVTDADNARRERRVPRAWPVGPRRGRSGTPSPLGDVAGLTKSGSEGFASQMVLVIGPVRRLTPVSTEGRRR